jgi:hypothetical protein
MAQYSPVSVILRCRKMMPVTSILCSLASCGLMYLSVACEGAPRTISDTDSLCRYEAGLSQIEKDIETFSRRVVLVSGDSVYRMGLLRLR